MEGCMTEATYNDVTIGNTEWWQATPEPYRASFIGRMAIAYIRLIVRLMKLFPRKDTHDPNLDWKKVRKFLERSESLVSVFLRTPTSLPAGGSPVPSAWFSPESLNLINTTPARTILYVHGGSYCLDRTKLHNKLAANLAEHAQARVLSVDYGLAPENPFPDGIEDVVKSYRWLIDQGISSQNIALVGDSAGAGIALAALLAMRDQKMNMPAAYVALCPWADLTFSGASIIENAKSDPFMSDLEFVSFFADTYRHGVKASHPLVSPALADLSGMPNTLIHAGGSDVLLDDARSIVNGIRKAGGYARLDIWEDMPHVWQKLSELIPDSKTSLVMIGHFLRSHIPEPHPRREL